MRGEHALVRCPVWSRTFDHPGSYSEQAIDYALDTAIGTGAHANTVVVTGVSWDAATDYDFATVAYRVSDGAELWRARYAGPGTSQDHPAELVTAGPTVFVAGKSGDRAATVAYDIRSGRRLWHVRYRSPRAGESVSAAAIAVSPDGRHVYVAGTYADPKRRTEDMVVLGYSSGGRLRWHVRAGSAAGGADVATDVVLDRAGRLFVVGAYDARGVDHWSDFAVLAYDVRNARRARLAWRATYDFAGLEDVAAAAAVTPDGSRLIVTGRSGGTAAPKTYDYATVAYDARSGRRAWAARVTHGSLVTQSTVGHVNAPTAITMAPDGARVYVTGYLLDGQVDQPSRRYQWGTAAYSVSDGAQEWLTVTSTPGFHFEVAMDLVANSSRVYVVGYSAVSAVLATATSDSMVASYSASRGETEWTGRWNPSPDGTNHAYGLSAALSGERVVVTGPVFYYRGLVAAPGNLEDYGTVAFPA